MLLGKDVSLKIFDITNDSILNVAEIDEFTSMVWPGSWVGQSKVEIWAQITEKVKKFLVPGKWVWAGGDSVMQITHAEKKYDDNGAETYYVYGYTAEFLLEKRVIRGLYEALQKDPVSIMHEVVSLNCIDPSDSKRKYPFLEASEDELLGQLIDYQVTGNTVSYVLSEVCESTGLGYGVSFDPRNKTLKFAVKKGVDRSINQSEVEPVILSTDLEDIISSSYYYDSQDDRNVAVVNGKFSMTIVKKTFVVENGDLVEKEVSVNKEYTTVVDSGDVDKSGFERAETFENGEDIFVETEEAISYEEEEEYKNAYISQLSSLLRQRGIDSLADWRVIENFDADIRVSGNHQYVFGIDYDLGDIVTVIDERLKVIASAQVTEYDEEYEGDEYNLNVTFGYAYPTIMKKIRRKIY